MKDGRLAVDVPGRDRLLERCTPGLTAPRNPRCISTPLFLFPAILLWPVASWLVGKDQSPASLSSQLPAGKPGLHFETHGQGLGLGQASQLPRRAGVQAQGHPPV